MVRRIIYMLTLFMYLLFISSCAENFKSKVRIWNDTDYDIINLEFGDEDYSTLAPDDYTSYRWFMPNSYRLKCVVNSPDDVRVKKIIQINMLKIYTIRIRLDSDDDGKVNLMEDGSL